MSTREHCVAPWIYNFLWLWCKNCTNKIIFHAAQTFWLLAEQFSLLVPYFPLGSLRNTTDRNISLWNCKESPLNTLNHDISAGQKTLRKSNKSVSVESCWFFSLYGVCMCRCIWRLTVQVRPLEGGLMSWFNSLTPPTVHTWALCKSKEHYACL